MNIDNLINSFKNNTGSNDQEQFIKNMIDEKKRKIKRPKNTNKELIEIDENGNIVNDDKESTNVTKSTNDTQQSDQNFVYTNNTYDTTYNETNNMLRGTIQQADILASELKNQLDSVINSKTIKNKYQHVSLIGSAIGGLLSTKITAIREINKSTTDAHNLELKRIKDLNLNTVQNKDDDQYIMEMYNAYISAPYGIKQGLPYNPQNLSTIGAPGIMSNHISNNIIRTLEDPDASYNEYLNNLTPEQHAMRLEHDNNVKTVVVYDQTTGHRYFDVQDMRTGQSIPNISKPDPMFLENTILDTRNRIARNTDLNTTYPLIIIGDTISEY